MTTTTAGAGWYPDPQQPMVLRWFDGASWTEHTAPRPGVPGGDPSDPVHWLLPVGRSWQSIAAGYVALVAIVFWFLGPIALALGGWALYVSARTGTHGKGRAWFAVVVGLLATGLMLVVIAQ